MLADRFPDPCLGDVRAYLLEHAAIQHYGPGQIVAVPGDDFTGIGFVLRGVVHASAESEDGREVVISTKRTGDPLHELSWFDSAPLPLTLRANRAGCEVFLVSGSHVMRCFRESPAFRVAFLAFAAAARRSLIDRIRELSFYLVRSRVARRLLDAAENGERVSMSGLAMTVATVPDVAARTIRQLEREGLIAFERGYARIVNRAALHRAADLAGRGDRTNAFLLQQDAS